MRSAAPVLSTSVASPATPVMPNSAASSAVLRTPLPAYVPSVDASGPIGVGDGHTAADHARAAALVAAHGEDSLAPFLPREDKALFFAAGGVLAYRVLGRTAVVSSDPVAPPDRAAEVLDAFRTAARSRRWSVAVTAASERHLAAYADLGLRHTCIGQEAVVDVDSFTLSGRRMHSVRHAVSRLGKRGWTIETKRGCDLSPQDLTELVDAERRWAAEQTRITGFSMTLGRLWGAPEDGASTFAIARDPDGCLGGYVRFADHCGGLSLDAMRRVAAEPPNGMNEALVVAAIEDARDRGLASVSLNFAGFGHIVGRDPVSGTGARIARVALRRAGSRFQMERLIVFNEKFRPRWEPRFLVYAKRSRLPVVAWRVLQAEAYVGGPSLRPVSGAWAPAALPVPASAPAA